LAEVEPADKPGSVESSHSSRTCVTTSLEQPTRGPYGPYVGLLHAPLFGLALGGVYLATTVTSCAVRSYRTLSPLPEFTFRRYTFCCTFHGFTSSRRYLAPCPKSPDFPPPHFL